MLQEIQTYRDLSTDNTQNQPVQILPPQLHAALPANPTRADLVFATIAPFLSTSLPLAPSTLEAD
jgi:hypothetical protein